MSRVPVVVLLLMAMACLPSAASAASLVLDDPEPALKQDGDAWKIAVGLTNIGDAPVTVTPVSTKPAVTADDGCAVSLKDAKPIPPAQHADIEVRYSAGCEIPDSGVAFRLDTDATPAQAIGPLSAAPKDDGDVEWIALVSFPIAWVLGTLLLWAAVKFKTLKRKGGIPVKPSDALTYLPATWKFGDSWATNITLLAGVLTSVVGTSGVVKAILGEDADSAIALATVGAAIAGVIIGLGAVVLQSVKTVDQDKGVDAYTGWGLVTAGGVTLAGAYGQLWVTYRMGSKLTLGGVQDRLWIPMGLAGVLLAVYACRNVRTTIRAGATPPPDPPAAPDVSALLEALLEHLQLQDGTSKEDVMEAVATELAAQPDVVMTPAPDAHAALL
jgi:hypothetical protein